MDDLEVNSGEQEIPDIAIAPEPAIDLVVTNPSWYQKFWNWLKNLFG